MERFVLVPSPFNEKIGPRGTGAVHQIVNRHAQALSLQEDALGAIRRTQVFCDDVGGDGVLLGQPVGHGLEVLRPASHQNEIKAFGGQLTRKLGTDSGRCTGDERRASHLGLGRSFEGE